MEALLQVDHHAYTSAMAETTSKIVAKPSKSPTRSLSVSDEENQFPRRTRLTEDRKMVKTVTPVCE